MVHEQFVESSIVTTLHHRASCQRWPHQLIYVPTMPAQVNEKAPADGVQHGARESANRALRFKAAFLFTGIGGFDIGLERAGFDIVVQWLRKGC